MVHGTPNQHVHKHGQFKQNGSATAFLFVLISCAGQTSLPSLLNGVACARTLAFRATKDVWWFNFDCWAWLVPSSSCIVPLVAHKHTM